MPCPTIHATAVVSKFPFLSNWSVEVPVFCQSAARIAGLILPALAAHRVRNALAAAHAAPVQTNGQGARPPRRRPRAQSAGRPVAPHRRVVRHAAAGAEATAAEERTGLARLPLALRRCRPAASPVGAYGGAGRAHARSPPVPEPPVPTACPRRPCHRRRCHRDRRPLPPPRPSLPRPAPCHRGPPGRPSRRRHPSVAADRAPRRPSSRRAGRPRHARRCRRAPVPPSPRLPPASRCQPRRPRPPSPAPRVHPLRRAPAAPPCRSSRPARRAGTTRPGRRPPRRVAPPVPVVPAVPVAPARRAPRRPPPAPPPPSRGVSHDGTAPQHEPDQQDSRPPPETK